MTLSIFLYKLIISPIETVLEILFGIIFSFVFSNGTSIIFLSVIINLMILPLYQRADVLQREANETEKKISKWKSHIARNFKGDEKMLMTSTYYKEVGYTPIKQLGGMLPLMIQIPFFIAAYHFLSNYNFHTLNGEAFGIIERLDKPDAILSVGQMTINVLPILMTVINIVASAIYTKEAPLKSKIQLYVMAFLFMVLLYNSPSGLVIYWTMNNTFSLVKNICMDPKGKKWVKILTFYISLNALLIYAISVRFYGTKEKIFIAECLISTAVLIAAVMWIKKKSENKSKTKKVEISLVEKNDDVMHWSGMGVLTVLLGLLIPSAVISASTQEFIIISSPVNPTVYVFHALVISAGMFLLWYSVYYFLMREKLSGIINKITAIVILTGMIDYFFFGTKYGFMSDRFKYDKTPVITVKEMVYNILIILFIAAMILVLMKIKKLKRLFSFVYIVLIISMIVLSVSNLNVIKKDYSDFEAYNSQMEGGYDKKIIPLSTEGKNVMMIMIDKAVAYYVPYIFAEKPELKEKYDGFTCYTNAVSLGRCTLFGSPGLYGGYEYTPYYTDKREDMSMKDKHDEALKMLPKLFADNGWRVRVLDPPYAGYEEISDLTIFNDISGDVKAYLTGVYFYDEEDIITELYIKENDLFRYSLFRCVPLFMQLEIYGDGYYRDPVNEVRRADEINNAGGDVCTLEHMSELVEIDNSESYNYISIDNEATHEPALYSKPDYMTRDNGDFYPVTRYKENGEELLFDDGYQEAFYDIDMYVMIQLGEFFDYLRENGLYDNTRIIIASDHGAVVNQFSNDRIEEGECVFMVKDFGSKGFAYSTEFMTNADTPTISVEGLIDDPINPYTGNNLDSHEKEGGVIFLYSHKWSTSMQQGNRINLEDDAKWYRVHDDIYDFNNWEEFSE